MERLLQYMDDFEDLVFAVALQGENIRQMLKFTFFIITAVTVQTLCIFLAVVSPPLAVAAASILVVGMLYWGVVYKIPVATAA